MHREKEDTKKHNVMMQLTVVIIDCHFYSTTIHTLDIHIRRQLLPSIMLYIINCIFLILFTEKVKNIFYSFSHGYKINISHKN